MAAVHIGAVTDRKPSAHRQSAYGRSPIARLRWRNVTIPTFCSVPEGVIDTEPPAPSRKDDRRLHLFHAGVVLIGLALRLWGIMWSLPDARHPIATYHPDELINLRAAEQADLPHGRLDIGFYNYGAFYFYLISLAQTSARGYHLIPATGAGGSSGPTSSAALRAMAPEQAASFLTGRIVTALMGTATIPVLFLLGLRLYDGRTGLLAALFYAGAPLAVVHAHFLTVDVPATLFVTLALLGSAGLLARRRWRDIALTALWCGLAIATKYTSGICMVAPILAIALPVFQAADRDRPVLRREAAIQIAALAGLTAIVFLIACPGPWINTPAFMSAVQYELIEHAHEGHGYLFVGTGPAWWYHLTVSLRYGLGLPLLVLSCAGVVAAFVRRRPSDLLLLVFLGVAYAGMSFSAVRFARYLIPLYPALCLLAARVVTSRYKTAASRGTAVAIGGLTAAACLLVSASLVSAMSKRDPRDRAADYLSATARPDSSIGFADIPWFYSPPLSPYWGAMAPDVRQHAKADPVPFQLRIPNGDWEPRVLDPPPDYVIISNIELQAEWNRLRLPQAVAFMNTVTEQYTPNVFRPAAVPGISPDDPNLPQDLLYVLPKITVYRQKTR